MGSWLPKDRCLATKHANDERRDAVDKGTQTDSINESKVDPPVEEPDEEIFFEIPVSDSHDKENEDPESKRSPRVTNSSKTSREEILVGGMSRAEFEKQLKEVGQRFNKAVNEVGRSHALNIRKTHEEAVTKTAQHIMSRIRPYQTCNTQCFIYGSTGNELMKPLEDVYNGLGVAVQSVSSLNQINFAFHDHDFYVIHFLSEDEDGDRKLILEFLKNKQADVPCLLLMQTVDCDEDLDCYGFVNVLAVCVDRSEFTVAFARNFQQQSQLLDIASIVSMTINQMESYDMSYAMSDTLQNKVFLRLT